MIERIQKLMKLNKINAITLTTKAGLTRSAVSDWKSGKSRPSTDAVVKMAEYFGVSTDYILLGKEDFNNLSDNEKELIELFRELDNKQQLKFIGKAELIIEGLLGENNNTKSS